VTILIHTDHFLQSCHLEFPGTVVCICNPPLPDIRNICLMTLPRRKTHWSITSIKTNDSIYIGYCMTPILRSWKLETFPSCFLLSFFLSHYFHSNFYANYMLEKLQQIKNQERQGHLFFGIVVSPTKVTIANILLSMTKQPFKNAKPWSIE